MKFLVLIFVTLFSCHSFAAIKCGAYIKTFTESGSVQIIKKPLKLAFESAAQFRLEVDIGQVNFSLLAEKNKNEHLLIITEGPEYVDGVITKGSFDSNGILNLGKVSANTVHKIECKKKSN